jgi:hypothetical protein
MLNFTFRGAPAPQTPRVCGLPPPRPPRGGLGGWQTPNPGGLGGQEPPKGVNQYTCLFVAKGEVRLACSGSTSSCVKQEAADEREAERRRGPTLFFTFMSNVSIVLQGRKSGFRAGFGPASDRESIKSPPAGGQILMFCRLESGRNAARKPDFRPGSILAQPKSSIRASNQVLHPLPSNRCTGAGVRASIA